MEPAWLEARNWRSWIRRFMEQTATNYDLIDFMLHDFGFRGVASVEAAGVGGAGHLVNFKGTDTVAAIEYAMEYYNAEVCAYSVPATEHSIMTSYGPEGEEKIFEDLIKEYPTGILSVVADSYDIFRACREIIGENLKEKILERYGVFVVRPDSGDPVATVLKILEILGDAYGTETNYKGFKELNPKIRILWGDGLDYDKIYDILLAMKNAGWSAANMATFGMGGGLLQKINRDTQRFAFKCSAQKRDGKWLDIFKDPADKTKASKKGRLALVKNGENFFTVPETENTENLLDIVFEDGKIVKEIDFEAVRDNAEIKNKL